MRDQVAHQDIEHIVVHRHGCSEARHGDERNRYTDNRTRLSTSAHSSPLDETKPAELGCPP
jgi:hypothetical protein